ncbi:hypothetical protein RTCIAT899_CH17610 [Rhizobium tropici CIAT 899]|nr:hypothetical protein RTCIAT899_CH17610 [Rhizobium tropici CIAT 899]TGE94992.1 hypothetical protein C9417_21715 [Rhizobium sp. SEMIA 4088]
MLWLGKHAEGVSLNTDITAVREIRYSKSSFIVVLVIYCFLAAGLAAMLIKEGPPRFLALILLPMLIFFIAFAVYEYFRRDFVTPVITIGPQGIQDIRIASGFIPWEHMDGVIFATMDPRTAKAATIFVNAESKSSLSDDLVAKIWRRSKRPRPVLIRRGQFDTQFKNIAVAVDLYYRAYKPKARNAENSSQQPIPA